MENIKPTRWALVVCILAHLIKSVAGQEDSMWDPASDDFIFLLLGAIFMFNFIVPPIRLIYEKYLKGLIIKAGNKIKEIQAKINERMSDASRKLSDRMTTV